MNAPIQAMMCGACGGTMAFRIGHAAPACVYCGTEALEPLKDAIAVDPDGYLPFSTTQEEARASFVSFASASWWTPGAFKEAATSFKDVLVPAWSWRGTVTVYWAGLKRASTKSGQRPVSGSKTAEMRGVMVPSSRALTRVELRNLGVFDEESLQPWDANDPPGTFEIATLTEAAAYEQGVLEMGHRLSREAAPGISDLGYSAVGQDDVSGQAVYVPVYIGVATYREKPFRVLVNGRTGAITGDRPIDPIKVAMVVLGVLSVIGAIVYFGGGMN